jgi:hypothetical protein
VGAGGDVSALLEEMKSAAVWSAGRIGGKWRRDLLLFYHVEHGFPTVAASGDFGDLSSSPVPEVLLVSICVHEFYMASLRSDNLAVNKFFIEVVIWSVKVQDYIPSHRRKDHERSWPETPRIQRAWPPPLPRPPLLLHLAPADPTIFPIAGVRRAPHPSIPASATRMASLHQGRPGYFLTFFFSIFMVKTRPAFR